MTVLAVDVSCFAYREWHSGGNLPTKIVQKCRAAKTIQRGLEVYMCYDSKPTFRHKIFSEYKGNRPHNPDKQKIEEGIEQSKILALAAGLRIVQADNYEADDVMSSLARQCRLREEPCWLVSTDKDMIPLLNFQGVRLFGFIRDHGHHSMLGRLVELIEERTEQKIIDRYGVECWQWLDFRCLCGDTSDNIKGLAGYGEKKSRRLLDAFETLDNMYRTWDQVKYGFSTNERKKLEDFRDELPTLRSLFRMVDSLEVLQH